MDPTPDEEPPVIQVTNLCHSYKKTRALTMVSFSVAPRSIHGFVGPNGAGKTTTLKILATLLRPQRGHAEVFGHDVHNDYKAVRRHIGFMPDHFNLYRQMTVYECLDFFGAAYGLPRAQRDRVIEDLLKLTDMEGRKDDLIKSLSRGMLQRVGLARALVHDPDLLLLDEPAAGLDPRARIELMEILRELSRLGKTVFISSHILSELGDLCDSVTIIDRGMVRYSGAMHGLLRGDSERVAYVLTLEAEHDGLQAVLEAIDGMTTVVRPDEKPVYRLAFDRSRTDTSVILAAVLQSGARIASFREDMRQLSQAFMELTEPGVPS